MRRFLLAAATFIATALVACGSGGGTSGSIPSSQTTSSGPTASSDGRTTAVIQFHVAATTGHTSKKAAARRSPQYYDSNVANTLQIEDDYTDSAGVPHQVFVYADVSPGNVLCPAATRGGGYNCSVAAPAFPGVTNTYNVSSANGNVGNLVQSTGYGTTPNRNSAISMGSGSITPTAGTLTPLAIVLNAIVDCIFEDSTGQNDGAPDTLSNPSHFVDNSNSGNGTPNRYVVVANSANPSTQSDIVAINPDNFYCDPIGSSYGGGGVYAVPSPLPSGQTPAPHQVYAQWAPQPFVLTTPAPASGLTVMATTSLSTLMADGRIRMQFTYDGHTTTAAQFTISTGISASVMDQFGNSYYNGFEGYSGGSMLYEIDPFSIAPQTATLSASATTATLTASEPRAASFSAAGSPGTRTGSCRDAGSTVIATYAIGGLSGSPAPITLTYVTTPTPGDTCTFQIQDDLSVKSTPITVTVQ